MQGRGRRVLGCAKLRKLLQKNLTHKIMLVNHLIQRHMVTHPLKILFFSQFFSGCQTQTQSCGVFNVDLMLSSHNFSAVHSIHVTFLHCSAYFSSISFTICFGMKTFRVLKEVTVVAMIAFHVNIISHRVPLINSGLLNNRAAHSPIK